MVEKMSLMMNQTMINELQMRDLSSF